MSYRSEFPLQTMCRVLDVSRSGYYEWVTRKDSPRKLENKTLRNKIKVIHADSRKTYGSPRITEELNELPPVWFSE